MIIAGNAKDMHLEDRVNKWRDDAAFGSKDHTPKDKRHDQDWNEPVLLPGAEIGPKFSK